MTGHVPDGPRSAKERSLAERHRAARLLDRLLHHAEAGSNMYRAQLTLADREAYRAILALAYAAETIQGAEPDRPALLRRTGHAATAAEVAELLMRVRGAVLDGLATEVAAGDGPPAREEEAWAVARRQAGRLARADIVVQIARDLLAARAGASDLADALAAYDRLCDEQAGEAALTREEAAGV